MILRLTAATGPHAAEIDDRPPGERRLAGQHADPEGCAAGDAQERDGLRELYCFEVRLILASLRNMG